VWTLQYLFYLNGEYEELARLEVSSLLSAYGINYRLRKIGTQALLVDSDEIPDVVMKRLALTHRVMEYLGALRAGSGRLLCEPVCRVMVPGSFSLRIKKIDKDINSMLEERRISEQIIECCDARVDLKSPDNEFYGMYVDGTVYVGMTRFQKDSKSFLSRKPQYRPYFHPSSIDPRIARALVNISEATREVMDPFCGTGGILIEAGLMGMKAHGVDIEEKMVEGTRMNLSYYGIEGDILRGDTSRIEIDRPYESVVTDVPYGKSTVVGEGRDMLYRAAFRKIYEMCSGKTVIVLPFEHDFNSYGFIIEEMIAIRVHKSLNRHIYKLGK